MGTASVSNNGNLLTVSGTGNITIASGISGAGGLIKTNTGTLSLTGSNTYAGMTLVSKGALDFSGGSFTAGGGTGTRNININGGGTLRVSGSANVYLPGMLGLGSAAEAVANNLVMSGGTLTVNGIDSLANLYRAFIIGEWPTETSVFTMSGGTLNVTNGNARLMVVWDAAAGAWNMYGGLARVGAICMNKAGTNIGTLNLTNGVIAVGAGGITNVTASYKLNLGGGTLASSASWVTSLSATLTGSGGNVSFAPANGQTIAWNGVLAGAGGLNLVDVGTLTLSSANTFSNGVAISAGLLKLGADHVIPDGAGKGNVVMNPASGTALLDLAGRTETINGLASSGAGASVVTNSSATAVTLTAGANNQSSVFGGNIVAGTGAISLSKTGTGALTLSGSNTYTGTTAVASGTLIYNGSQAAGAGAVNISTSAMLAGTGTLASVVTVANGGTLSPGAPVGALTAATNVMLSGGAVLAVTLDAAQAPYCGKLAAGKLLTLTGATLAITTNGVPHQAVYVIATYGTRTGTFAVTNGLPAGYTLDYAYNAGTAIALVASLVDSDGDGMDDNWEIANFGSTGALNGLGDQDGDGFSDRDEYLAGTSPTNRNSLLALKAPSSFSSNQVVVTWASVLGKKYQLLTSTNLLQPGWQTNLAGIDGLDPETSITNTIASPNIYFRIKLEE